ncbi:DUF1376 domain-containing protein [Bartonella sp. B10]
MSSKLPWVRNFYQEWIMDFAGTDAAEKATYSTLTALMYRACEPIYDDTSILARFVGCSVKTFKKSLEKLIRKKLILQLENGKLWSAQVEEELNNSNESLEKVSKTSRSKRLSERAQKAAQARWAQHKIDAKHDACGMLDDTKHDAYGMLNDAKHDAYGIKHDGEQKEKKRSPHTPLKENKNINKNKKTNTIVLAKKEKEMGAENSETDLPIHGPKGSDAFNRLSAHDEISLDASSNVSEITSAVKSSFIHEQGNVFQKVKRFKTDRGCRLPDDFEPDYAFAIQEGLSPECVKVEMEKFRDYWRAKTGKDATKRDWPATWRNWIRNSKNYGNRKIGNNYAKQSDSPAEQQRGWGYRVAQHMSNIKDSGSAYEFLFAKDEYLPAALEEGTKTLCNGNENGYISHQ